MTKSNEEIWKPIKDYENLYEISNFGVIRKVKTKRPLKAFYRTNGYYTTSLCKNYKVTMIYLHRVIAETFIPNPNNYPVINHIDGNKSNNYVDNLEWCSHKYNVQHAFKNGLNNPATHIPKQYRQKCDLAYEYIIRHKRKDGFLNLNEWQTKDLLKILEVNDAKR